MNQILGKWPAVVKSYDGVKRLAMVVVPGITDEPVEATFEYPIGDRAQASHAKEPTEILVKPDDLVWVEFEAADPRYPIITGYRTPRQGNPTGWRRWHAPNIEMTADGQMVLNADTLTINAKVHVVGSELTHNGTNVGDTHVHDEQGDFQPVSPPR